ncbi:acetyltransferase [Flavimarina sp. Hel_I_48]|uniref:acetyltransferase n=1 Tax=Flavimarina sp. Hel_I_48 TaxID=1392488 RepID=UPI0004DECD41|nr:acetyltransferase [Flavimarina sp. Hel_I_48]
MLDKEVILIGYSGHGFVVAETALLCGLKLNGYTEIHEIALNPFKLEYLGFESDANFEEWKTDKNYILGIGDNKIRVKVANLIRSRKKKIVNVMHPQSSVSKTCQMGEGNFVSKNVSINALARIGDYCILNTASIIEHECTIGNGVHIAPGAVLAGNVTVGDLSFIGANAVVKQGVRIGKNVTIGAGTVVLNDIADNQKIVGNPGRSL